MLRVADTGIGIDPTCRTSSSSFIRRPPARRIGSRQRASICKSIVQAHHGGRSTNAGQGSHVRHSAAGRGTPRRRRFPCNARCSPIRVEISARLDQVIGSSWPVPYSDAWHERETAVVTCWMPNKSGRGSAGRQIAVDYAGRSPSLIGVLTGSLVLLADLMRRIDLPLHIRLVQARSYQGAATRPGNWNFISVCSPRSPDRTCCWSTTSLTRNITLDAGSSCGCSSRVRCGSLTVLLHRASSRRLCPITSASTCPTCSSSATGSIIKTLIATCLIWPNWTKRSCAMDRADELAHAGAGGSRQRKPRGQVAGYSGGSPSELHLGRTRMIAFEEESAFLPG